MGTTIVIAWILNDKAYICWCGDSRCYVFNANSGFCRLSKDHSYVQDLVDQGKLDPENAFWTILTVISLPAVWETRPIVPIPISVPII